MDLNKLLGQILGADTGPDQGGILGQGRGRALAGGAILGGLAGAMTGKSGKKLAKSALKVGGAAAIAGLAYTAYRRYQNNQPAAKPSAIAASGLQSQPTALRHPPDHGTQDIIDVDYDAVPPAGSRFLPAPADTGALESLSAKMIQGMIAAAKADGRISGEEGGKIFAQVEAANLADDERSFLLAEMSKNRSPEEIAQGVDCPEIAADIYAAAALAVDRAGPAERSFLERLAENLKLAPDYVVQIHRRIADVRGPS